MTDDIPNKYESIIDQPHHISQKHPQLDKSSYAAQFSPFAALSGYDDIIIETARLTDERRELSETEMEILSAKMRKIEESIDEQPEYEFTIFVSDLTKSGGSYRVKKGRVKRIDHVERLIRFTDGTKLPIDDVICINEG